MQYLEAVNSDKAQFKSIFLAGGIRDCRDWQRDLVGAIAQSHLDVTIFNPRRGDKFPNDDSEAYNEQVKWEFDNLRRADVLSFWFDNGSLNPTTLLEFGSAIERRFDNLIYQRDPGKLIVGCHPDYIKLRCIKVQAALIDPKIEINIGFENFVAAVLKILRNEI